MILLLLGWSPVGGVVGFILLVRKEEGLVGFPFGGEVRWAGLEEGRSEWVRALVVCVCVGESVKPEKNSIFLKNGKTVISVENRKFSKSRMTKRIASLNSSREI